VLLDWIAKEPLRRADFSKLEQVIVVSCLICAPSSAGRLSPGKADCALAEYVARTLWLAQNLEALQFSSSTRLTQQRRTEQGQNVDKLSRSSKGDHLCRGCGKTITNESTHLLIALLISDGTGNWRCDPGRIAARSRKLVQNMCDTEKHAKACSEWDASTQPAWLTSEVFSQQIQRYLRTFQYLRFDHELAFRVGMQAGSGRLSPASEALAPPGSTRGHFPGRRLAATEIGSYRSVLAHTVSRCMLLLPSPVIVSPR